MRFTTDYSGSVFNKPTDYAKLITRTAKRVALLKKKHKNLGIAFRGQSGSALAYPVAAKLKMPLILVRKNTESSHSSYKIEGCTNKDVDNYIIIDDFISSGKTVNTIIREIDKYQSFCDNPAKCVGIVLYASSKRNKTHKDYPVYYVSRS